MLPPDMTAPQMGALGGAGPIAGGGRGDNFLRQRQRRGVERATVVFQPALSYAHGEELVLCSGLHHALGGQKHNQHFGKLGGMRVVFRTVVGEVVNVKPCTVWIKIESDIYFLTIFILVFKSYLAGAACFITIKVVSYGIFFIFPVMPILNYICHY